MGMAESMKRMKRNLVEQRAMAVSFSMKWRRKEEKIMSLWVKAFAMAETRFRKCKLLFGIYLYETWAT